MAATVSSSVWGVKSKPGAWALDAEQHEEDLLRDLQSSTTPTEPPSADFPTLAAAASTKTKKKKPQTLSLAEFSTYTPSVTKPSQTDELLALPTGPRERSAEELERSRSGFGGGFRSYGYDSANPRARVSERDRADDGPSRADEADDWSKTKRVDGDRRDKVGFFNSSRADEVDNWASNKSFAPSEGRRERRSMGFDSFSNGADSDNWTRAKEERDGSNVPRERERRGVGFESSSGAADSENWMKKKESNGGVVDAGRPRLNLQRRTVPINNTNIIINEVKPKGSNPFGLARPREEVLKDKGQDWKEIDDKLEAQKAKEEGAELRRKGFGLGRNDSLLENKSWRKPASSVEKVENENADKAEDSAAAAAENTENGDAEKN